MKKLSSYTAYPAFLGKCLNRDTNAAGLTSETENECTVRKKIRHQEVDEKPNITRSTSTIFSEHGACNNAQPYHFPS